MIPLEKWLSFILEAMKGSPNEDGTGNTAPISKGLGIILFMVTMVCGGGYILVDGWNKSNVAVYKSEATGYKKTIAELNFALRHVKGESASRKVANGLISLKLDDCDALNAGLYRRNERLGAELTVLRANLDDVHTRKHELERMLAEAVGVIKQNEVDSREIWDEVLGLAQRQGEE